MKSGLLLISMLFCSSILQTNAQAVVMTVEGIRSNKGVISMGIFKSQQQFTQEKPAIGKVFPKTNLRSGVLEIEFDLDPGVKASMGGRPNPSNTDLLSYSPSGL